MVIDINKLSLDTMVMIGQDLNIERKDNEDIVDYAFRVYTILDKYVDEKGKIIMETKIEPASKLAELMISIMDEKRVVNSLQEYVKPKGAVKFAWGKYEELSKDAYQVETYMVPGSPYIYLIPVEIKPEVLRSRTH